MPLQQPQVQVPILIKGEMMKYLIYKENVYPLFTNRTYELGLAGDIAIDLPFLNNLSLDVKSDSIMMQDKSYGIGRHDILLTESDLITILVFESERSFFCPEQSLYISKEEDATITLSNFPYELLASYQDEGIQFISSQSFYLNGKLMAAGETFIKENDLLVFNEGLVLSFESQQVRVQSLFELGTKLTEIIQEEHEDRTIEFHRSPRIILREPEGKIVIASAPTDEHYTRQNLVKLLITPVAMVIFTILMYFFAKSGPFIFMMMGMSVITIGTSVHTYFSDKKHFKEGQIQKIKDYMIYLNSKYKELTNYRNEQIDSLKYHYPTTDEIFKMVDRIDRRIFEKSPYYFDFMTYSLGLSDLPSSFKIEYSESELTKYNEEAANKVQELLSYYKQIADVPIRNMVSSPIGYIGSRRVVIEQVQQLMIQLSAFQSYHDLQFVAIFREEELPLWNWSRWLPHLKINAINCRGFVYNQQTRDQILTSFYQIIKERKLDSEQERGKEIQFSPKYIFLITDMSLLLDHNIMEYINDDLSHLGVHFVFVEDVIESLPEHVKTVIDYRGEKKATLLLQDGVYQNKSIKPLPPVSESSKENFARQLASVNHVQTLRNSIPESITFLEMYGVEKVSELNLLERWNTNEAYQTMAVPLGVRGKDDVLYLNLHEKAHGPHGLIAGTTGSGKSELVQSYILSLAVNFHPYEVAFLLIDYKGGGMANLFADLPHLVGTITNLDGNQANRALVSINAELEKRQRLFNEYNVNHIDQYNKLFKEGKAKEPLPHLLIISDEFAELKQEQPDFMDELVSTARIGRSLGVNLILATQKPSGVVNDQIWSNSKFKIALKMQDVSDSREVIKTPDAAEITQTGRAYLQVGNNEIYELFQSAWSGAPYSPEGKYSSQIDRTVYEITSNGQYQPINKDLSGLSKKKDLRNGPTELDAVVQLAKQEFEQLNICKVARPWLPPLKQKIYSSELQSTNFEDFWGLSKNLQPVLIGYQDIPERQEQSPLYLDMETSGHILLLSSPGFGKSTFLQSFSVDVMRKHRPDQAHFYLYDFGTSGLVSLADFPHIADYFSLDEAEKILKSLRFLMKEVKRRKKALSAVRATNLKQFNQISDEEFPTIFIEIDGFDSVSDAPFVDEMYQVLSVIARDGASIGIYLLVTLSRLNAMRLQLQANFKTKLSMFLFDKSDLSGIVGRSNIPLDEIKGRVITKFENILQFQVALPFNSEFYSDYIEEVRSEAKMMHNLYDGPLPKKIPMLPERVTEEILAKELTESKDFVFGLEREEVLPVSFKLAEPMLLASNNPASINHYYKLLSYTWNRLADEYNTVIIDPSQRISSQLFPGVQRFNNSSDVQNVMRSIVEDFKKRISKPDLTYPKWNILIPDIAATAKSSSISDSDLKLLLSEGEQYGVTIHFVGSYQDLINNTYDTFVQIVKQMVSQVFIGMQINDQNHTRYPYISNERPVRPNQGYILYPDRYVFVQLLEFQDN